jgi:hypothetical protein
VEAELLRPDSNHSPGVQQNDSDGYSIEHRLGGKAVAFLDVPEAEDAHGLGGNSDDEEVGEVEGVVGHNGVLKGSDHGDSCVQRVAEEEVAWIISKSWCVFLGLSLRTSNLPIK